MSSSSAHVAELNADSECMWVEIILKEIVVLMIFSVPCFSNFFEVYLEANHKFLTTNMSPVWTSRIYLYHLYIHPGVPTQVKPQSDT